MMLERINLQLFAEEVEEAEKTEEDVLKNLIDDAEKDTDIDTDTDTDTDIETDTETKEEEKEEQTEEEQAETNPDDEPKFSQNEMNRIIGQSRIKGREIEDVAAKIQAETGLSLPQVYEEIRRLKEAEYVTKQTSEGYMTEEEARDKYRIQTENKVLQNKIKQIEQQQAATQRYVEYNQEKSGFYSDPRVKKHVKDLARKYEKEIDAISQNGVALDWSVARAYIIGQKLENEDILENIQSGTEKRTLANVTKRSKASPEGSSQSGGDGKNVGLTPLERKFASVFDVTEKEYVAQKAKIAKEKK